MGRKEDKLKKDTRKRSGSKQQEDPFSDSDTESVPRSLRSRRSGTGLPKGAKPSSIKTSKLTNKTPQRLQQDSVSDDSDSSSDSDIDPEIEDLARGVAQKMTANSSTKIGKNMTKDKKEITSQPLFVIDTGPIRQIQQKDCTNDASDDSDLGDGDNNEEHDINESDDGKSSSDDETELNVTVTTSVKQDLHLAEAAVSKETEKEGVILSSELQADFNRKQMYVNVDAYTQPKQNKKVLKDLLLSKKKDHQLMEKSVLTADYEKKFAVPPYQESLNQLKKKNRLEREKSKGKGWFNLPAPEMDDKKKNDLMVIQMRRALDPKRFYKGPDMKALPKYFQMGTVVEGPADFYNSRIPKKQRKATLVDELLADAQFRQFNKRKYAEIVEHQARSRGPQKHMKRLKRSKKGK